MKFQYYKLLFFVVLHPILGCQHSDPTSSDYNEIRNLAIDSLLGDTGDWTDSSPLRIDEKMQVEFQFIDSVNLGELKLYQYHYPRFFKTYNDYDSLEFKSLLNSNAILTRTKSEEPNAELHSSFNYAFKMSSNILEDYDYGDPIGHISISPVLVSKGDNALIICNFYKDVLWSTSVAYLFKKKNGHWMMVAQKQIYIS